MYIMLSNNPHLLITLDVFADPMCILIMYSRDSLQCISFHFIFQIKIICTVILHWRVYCDIALESPFIHIAMQERQATILSIFYCTKSKKFGNIFIDLVSAIPVQCYTNTNI